MHETMNIDFSGRTVLITGASRGIAAEIARAFAHNGANVAINYCATADLQARQPDAAEKLLNELRAEGAKAEAIEADLLDKAGAETLLNKALRHFARIDVLVLSAAFQVNKRFLEQSPTEVEQQVRLNILSNVAILQRLIPAMRQTGWGRIVTIGSVQEEAPSMDMPVYSLTKSAQENLVRNLAVENAPYGITVNNVAPGLVETDRNERFRHDMSVWQELSANANPMGRAGTPADIAGAVLFLASEAASFITGTTIFATGGGHIASPRRRLSADAPRTGIAQRTAT